MNAARLGLCCLFVGISAADVVAQGRRAAAPVKSVDVAADHKVTFRISAPKADDVSVNGDFGGGKMTKDDNGVWSLTTEPLRPDFYSYSFTIDGVKTIDSKNPLFKPGNTGLDSMFEVTGPEAEFEAAKEVPHGELHAVWFDAGVLGGQRRMHIYTPPGYEGGSEKYPVLYLLHGSGDDDAGWPTIGRTGFILDNLIAAGKAKPMLVVMPNGSLSIPEGIRRLEDDGKTTTPEWRAAADANQAKLSKHIVDDIVSFVEKTYRVKTGPTNRALAGLSMGGGQTTRVLASTPDAFTYYGIWSAGIGKDGGKEWEAKNADLLAHGDRLNASIKILSICVGEKDAGSVEGSRALNETLNRHGIKNELHVSGGAHTWINWRKYLNELTPRLFQ